jgi:MoxR-like ATPase
MPVGEQIIELILDTVRAARPGEVEAPDFVNEAVSWGPGPRAAQSLMLTTRAHALLDGRLAPTIDDVTALAEPVLKHRMALGFTARAEGKTLEGIISQIITQHTGQEVAA